MDEKQLDLEKTLTTTQVNKLLDKTSEEYQALKAIVQEVMTEELEKQESDIKRTSQQIEQLLQQVIANQEQHEQSIL